jgi:hypothetical protein
MNAEIVHRGDPSWREAARNSSPLCACTVNDIVTLAYPTQ